MSNPAGEGDLLRSGWQARSKQEKVGARDKMQPSLLDRLTDNDPEKKRESANSNLITHAALRRNVLRDLQWLFNTINHDASGTKFSASLPRPSLTSNRVFCRRDCRSAACQTPRHWICTTCCPLR